MAITLDDQVPDAATASAVASLASQVERDDGAPPLNDQARTQLRSGSVGHVVARAQDGTVVGYAQRTGDEVQLVARPDAIDGLLDSEARPHTIWTHGASSRLVSVLEARGYEPTRELHQLRRPSEVALPADPPLADGVVVREFVPGQDEDAWLAVNAAAFATHPEQGRTSRADLDAREAEDWFDPSAFLLAERDGELLGFHWTKTHPDGAGEVYVLGIAPSAQGLGLGGALLVRGLRLLVDCGAPYVLLYVEGDNPAALHLYEKHGFDKYDLDKEWAVS